MQMQNGEERLGERRKTGDATRGRPFEEGQYHMATVVIHFPVDHSLRAIAILLHLKILKKRSSSPWPLVVETDIFPPSFMKRAKARSVMSISGHRHVVIRNLLEVVMPQ